MSDEKDSIRWWNRRVNPLVAVPVVVLIFAALFLSVTVPVFQTLWALVTGWIFHGIRVLPDAFGKWRSAVLPLASLGVVWWVGHRLMRWWLAARGSGLAEAWTARRSAALLGLVLLGAAAAVAISGVVHQMMWLGQTKWTQSGRGSDLTAVSMMTRNILSLIVEFDRQHGRLPETAEEFTSWGDTWDVPTGQDAYRWQLAPSFPILTFKGESWKELDPAAVLIVTDLVDGFHVVGTPDGVKHITPEQLDAIIARGDWKYLEGK